MLVADAGIVYTEVDYDMLLRTPILYQDGVTPRRIGVSGGVVTLSGSDLGVTMEVVVGNSLSDTVYQQSSSTSTRDRKSVV